MHFYLLVIFLFCQLVKYVIHVYVVNGHRPNFPHTKVWWLREASQSGKTFIPLCEKHSMAEFQAIQQFWLQLDVVSQQKKLTKIEKADPRVCGDVSGDQKPETLLGGLRYMYISKSYTSIVYFNNI